MSFKTTGIKNNVAIEGQSGRIGNVRYITRNGVQYVRTVSNKVTANSNPRTDAQMVQRLKHSSLVALFQLIGANLRGAFQYKEQNQSDYNAFIKANQGIGCYFTKNESLKSKVVAMPVYVSLGSLDTPVMDMSGVSIKSPLVVSGTLTTIGGLSTSIISNNAGYEHGDQIAFLCVDIANKKTSWLVLQLDTLSTESIPSWINTSNGVVQLNSVSCDACAMIHSNSDMEMSSSLLCLTSQATSAYSALCTQSAFKAARDSYGKATTIFLKPGTIATSEEPEPEPAPSGNINLTLLSSPNGAFSFKVGGVDKGYSSVTSHSRDEVVTVEVTADDAYIFDEWDDGETATTRQVTMDQSKSMTAVGHRNPAK